MGSRQKTGAEVAYLEPDEKGWIDGSASAGLSLAHHTSPQDEAARVCGDWLGRADEVESLSTRWGDIEAGLIKSHGWSELTDQQQRETPEANELYEIDARIESLINKQTETLRALPELKATRRSQARQPKGSANPAASG